MSGIYIHIPFCKQACHYCNFHFSTSMKYKSEIINAILKEIELQKNYLANKNIPPTPTLFNLLHATAALQHISVYSKPPSMP